MAIFKHGSLVTEIMGKLSGHVYSRARSSAVLSKRTYCKRPHFGRQDQVRQKFHKLEQLWKTLPVGWQDSFTSQAADNDLLNSIGQIYHESGLNLFCRLNYQRINFGLPVLLQSPGPAPSFSGLNYFLDFRPADGIFELDVLSPFPADTFYIIEASPMISPGVKYASDKVQQISFLTSNDAPTLQLSDFYRAIYGVGINDMPANAFVWFRITPVSESTGYKGTSVMFNSRVGFPFDFDAEQIIKRMGQVGPLLSEVEQMAINTYVLNLKGIGTMGASDIWSQLDYLRIGAMNNNAHALVEWRMLSGYGANDASLLGAPVFNSGQGYAGGAAAAIIESFVPNASPGGLFQLDNAFMGVLDLNGAVNEFSFGIDDGNNSVYWIYGMFTNGGACNSAAQTSAPVNYGSGWKSIRRNNAVSCEGFHDANLVDNFMVNSFGLSNFNAYSSGGNNAGLLHAAPNSLISVFFAGSDFSIDMLQFIQSYDQFLIDFNL